MRRLLLIPLLCIAFQSASFASIIHNVLDYGAKADGETIDSYAINKAIDKIANGGGGTLFFPAGNYLCGTIRLKSNITLELDNGATILAAPQPSFMDYYDKAEEFTGMRYQDEGHSYFCNSLIYGRGLRNVAIVGQGMIDGKGLVKDWYCPDTKLHGLANKSIALIECTNILVRDITIFRGGWFGIIMTGCNLATVDNVTMDTNRDGIDIDCSTNVTVSNSKFNTPIDDAICPKSSYALGRRIITENITITNCQVSGFQLGTLLDGTMQPNPIWYWTSRCGRIKLGTESNGGFRNIAISNCTFRNCKGLALEMVDGGVMENITVSNLAMYDVDDYPIYITLGERHRDPQQRKSIGRNITISDIVAYMEDSISGIHITGIPESKLENIRLRNIRLICKGGAKESDGLVDLPQIGKGYPEIGSITNMNSVVPSFGVFARHVTNLELSDISVHTDLVDLRPSMFMEDIDNVEIHNYKAPVFDQIPTAIFENVRKLKLYHADHFTSKNTAIEQGDLMLLFRDSQYKLINKKSGADHTKTDKDTFKQLKKELDALALK